MKFTDEDKKRFWTHVDKSGECWNWKSALDKDGYGVFRKPEGTITAHIASWLMSQGKTSLPKGQVVRHSCNNSKCVRPGHLSIGTVTDNMRDKMKSIIGSFKKR